MPFLLNIFIIEGLVFFILRQAFDSINGNLEFFSTLIIAINTILYLLLIAKYAKDKKEYMILTFAFFIRIIVLYWDIYGRSVFPLPNSGMDSEMYNNNAVMFAQGYSEGRGGFYSIIVGLIYKMFGVQRILAQYFNVILSICTIVTIKRIIEALNVDKKIRYFILLIICFLPNFVITSSILLRESIIIFFITLSLYFFIKWWEKRGFLYLVISICLPLLATMFHSGAIAPTLAYILSYIFYNHKRKKYSLNVRTITFGIGFIVLFFRINNIWGERLFGKFQDVDSVTDLSNKVDAYTSGGSAYLSGQQVSSVSDIILYTPIRMFYFLASPLPWDWRGLSDIIAFTFSAMLYLIAFYYAFKSLRYKDNINRTVIISLLIMAICSALIFSWGVSNAGTALRHREKFLGIYVILLAISINSIKAKRKLENNMNKIRGLDT